ncbi:MAG TPA: acyltransferase, partial [Lysobacter sp.]
MRTLADSSARNENNFNLIRLVAAWLVIYGHSYAVTGSGGGDLLLQLVHIKFAGAIAVEMFFLISGFLIAASVERNRLPQFLTARVLRIFPALVVCVALSVFVLGPLLTNAPDYWDSSQTWKYLRRNILLQATQYDLPGVFQDLPMRAVNGSLWSLPIEFRLYLVLGALGLLRLLRAWRFNAVFVAGLVAAFVLLRDQPLSSVQSTQLWCVAFFAAGAFAWVNRARIPLAWPLLVALLAIAALLRDGRYYPVAYFFALAYTTLFVAYVPRLPQIRHHDLSYGLYLYGWPSQQLVLHFAPGTGPLFNTAWATLLAGGLAALSWRFVERPALRLKSR